MTKAPKRQAWAKSAEQATLRGSKQNLTHCKNTFLKELSRKNQFRLMEEVVETRSAELCRAYGNVVQLAYGYRRKTKKRDGVQRIVRQPCITFIVKRKWRAQKDVRESEILPKYVLAYWTIKRERRLCAIPTDVEDARAYAKARPQSTTRGVEVRHGGKFADGAIACTIRSSESPDELLVISCRHVFKICTWRPRNTPWGIDVNLDAPGAARVCGVTTDISGKLRDGPSSSFDAQLARVTDIDALREALGGLRINGFAKGPWDVPDSYFVVTPRGPVRASLSQFLNNHSIDYFVDGLRDVIHERVIESDAATEKGDSGSPVLSGKDGGMLIGMHFAWSDGHAFSIPAYRLLNSAMYDNTFDGEFWKIVNP